MSTRIIKANREYKDRLFCFIFGNPENRQWTLELYNAINGTDYTDPSLIRINTIEDVLYLGMHNDVSFIIGETLSLYESQSTYNPNMPLRMMQYAASIYEGYCKENGLDKYSPRVLPLPAPRLVVFYNGGREEPDSRVLRLTDSFGGRASDIEVNVSMLNINRGHNKELMERCRPLAEYSRFTDSVSRYRVGMGLSRAIEAAIWEMDDDSALKDLLERHKAEVEEMLLTEYNEKEQLELTWNDGRKAGLEEGREEGREEGHEEGNKEGLELAALLAKEERYADIEKASKDPAYRKRLIEELMPSQK